MFVSCNIIHEEVISLESNILLWFTKYCRTLRAFAPFLPNCLFFLCLICLFICISDGSSLESTATMPMRFFIYNVYRWWALTLTSIYGQRFTNLLPAWGWCTDEGNLTTGRGGDKWNAIWQTLSGFFIGFNYHSLAIVHSDNQKKQNVSLYDIRIPSEKF